MCRRCDVPEAGKKNVKIEEPVSVSMKVMEITLSPLAKLGTMYSALPIAEHIPLPAFIGAAFAAFFVLWIFSRMLDPKPYLYNGGKLGYLEKDSVFVKAKKSS